MEIYACMVVSMCSRIPFCGWNNAYTYPPIKLVILMFILLDSAPQFDSEGQIV